jgi:hypothetical protein
MSVAPICTRLTCLTTSGTLNPSGRSVGRTTVGEPLRQANGKFLADLMAVSVALAAGTICHVQRGDYGHD